MNTFYQQNIEKIASFSNVYCKLSGMVTETKNMQWTKNDFTSFMDLIFSSFGIDRILYGSDWPVCLLASTYQEQLSIVQSYISTFSVIDKKKIMGSNAIDFYKLKVDKNINQTT